MLVPDLLVLFCLPCTIWFQHSVNWFSFPVLRVSDAFSHRSSSFRAFQILWLILLRALGFSSTSATSLPPPHPFLSLPVSPPVPWPETTLEEYAKNPEILLVRIADFVKFAAVKDKATWTVLGVSQGNERMFKGFRVWAPWFKVGPRRQGTSQDYSFLLLTLWFFISSFSSCFRCRVRLFIWLFSCFLSNIFISSQTKSMILGGDFYVLKINFVFSYNSFQQH